MSFPAPPRTAYTLRDLLLAAAAARPDHIALVDGARGISYRDLADQSLRFAAHLHRSGISRGDRVAVYLPRSIESVVALFGIWSAGGVGVVVNEVLKTRQVNYILEHAEASRLLTETRLLAGLENPFVPASGTILMDKLQRDRPGSSPGDRKRPRAHYLYLRLHRVAQGDHAQPY